MSLEERTEGPQYIGVIVEFRAIRWSEKVKLKTVKIDHFKHVLNSTPVEIQPDITCLVGKNESGKSAFLEALRRLNA